jgi:flagella basal body P-ring formation protein FlgA
VAKLTAIVALLVGAWMSAAAGGLSIVHGDELREAVKRYLVQREGADAERLELSFRAVPDSIGVPVSAYTLRVGMGSSNRVRGPVAFIVEVVAGEQTVHRCMVTAVIRTYDTVLVAGRTLARGAVLAEADLCRFRIETTGIDRPLAGSLASLEGKRSRRVIARGSLLFEDMFETLPLVYQGSSVRVLVRSGAVSILTEGTACQDGRMGELIEIAVRGKPGRLKARVADDYTVAVPAE